MSTAAAPRKTLRDHLKALAAAAFIVLMTLLMVEALLRLVDPWGLAYFEDLAYMGNVLFTPDAARGYVIPDGQYQFSHWSASVVAGGRALPATDVGGDCTLAILGDSVAFGYGVDDTAAWANLVAAQLPGVRLRNLAMPRYNSTNALQTFRAYPEAAGYVFVLIGNDIETAIDPLNDAFVGSGAGLPWLVRYMNFALFRGYGTDRAEAAGVVTQILPDSPLLRRLLSEIEALTADPRVRLVAFGNEPLTNTLLAQGYALTVLDYPAQQRISVADYHLNEEGNAALAAAILPVFEALRADVCGA